MIDKLTKDFPNKCIGEVCVGMFNIADDPENL